MMINTGISDLLVIGLISIVIGLIALVNVVYEVTPAKRNKWIISICLGSGIIAFGIKIALIVTMSAFPEQSIKMFPEKVYTKDIIDDYNKSVQLTSSSSSYIWEPLPHIAPSPADNPTTSEKISLGKKLFYDKRLSVDQTISCASCHEISDNKGGADGLANSIGFKNQKGNRNAPSVLNAAFQNVLFWDGRARSLEEQAKGPITNPIEMGMPTEKAVEERVAEIGEYQQLFKSAFPKQPSITMTNIAKAIAAYERTLITPNSAYDRFVQGETTALTNKQLRGMALFESVGCVQCHSGANFSGASQHGENSSFRIFPASPGSNYEKKYRLTDDLGLASGLKDSEYGVWRVPSLRNVARTAPYFHNGSVDNLEEAVRIMASLQLKKTISNKTNDDSLIFWSKQSRHFSNTNNQALNDDEIKAIVAFLESLNGDLSDISPKQYN